MKLKAVYVSLGVLMIIGILVSINLFYVTSASSVSIDENYLNGLRDEANVECLSDEQCGEGFECVGNSCRSLNEIGKCDLFDVSPAWDNVGVNDQINKYRRAFTQKQIPSILRDGRFVAISENGSVEVYQYSPVLILGDSVLRSDGSLEKGGDDYVYALKIYFSKGVDFSDERIQGQVLSILGQEHLVDGGSSNEVVRLDSDDGVLRLENNSRVKKGLIFGSVDDSKVELVKDEEENVLSMEFKFYEGDNVNLKDKLVDPVFDKLSLVYNSGFDEVKVGEEC